MIKNKAGTKFYGYPKGPRKMQGWLQDTSIARSGSSKFHDEASCLCLMIKAMSTLRTREICKFREAQDFRDRRGSPAHVTISMGSRTIKIASQATQII